MKKTSWILILFVCVVLLTVGIAYGKNMDLFNDINPVDPEGNGDEQAVFSPPDCQLKAWLNDKTQAGDEPEEVDYSAILLARAKKAEAEKAAAEKAEMERVAIAQNTQNQKTTVTQPIAKKPASSSPEPPKTPVEEPSEPDDPIPPQDEPETPSLKAPSGTAHTTAEAKVLTLVNGARAAEGLKPLTVNKNLIWLARLRAVDLVENNDSKLDHDTPTYGRAGGMLQDAGIAYKGYGENLALCSSPDSAFNLWMGSDGHRRNILSPNFTQTGVGIAYNSSSRLIICQIFINI